MITAYKYRPQSELIALRICVARCAQTLKLDEHIPGAAGRVELSYEHIYDCAETEQRGWNALMGRITDAIGELRS